MSKDCDECQGTGKKEEACEACDSKGWVHDPDDGGSMTCPDCNGESADDCDACEGTGKDLLAD